MADVLVGGQAVLEGVMMRAPGIMSVAVRRQDGSIQIQKNHLVSIADRWPIWRKPFFRGLLALEQSLVLGFKALNFSSAIALADMAPESDSRSSACNQEPDRLSAWSIVGVIASTLAIGFGVFFFLPLYFTEILGKYLPLIRENIFLFNAVDGIIRVLFFLFYIIAISFLPDIRRVFQYHGAEHKSIAAFEAGRPLILESARKFSSLHPRCGTSFLLMVMVVAIFVFTLIPSEISIWAKALSRILLLPVIAGLSFELIRKAGDSSSWYWRLWIAPGLWLQLLTTREPDDLQLEVGLEALKSALENSDNSKFDLII